MVRHLGVRSISWCWCWCWFLNFFLQSHGSLSVLQVLKCWSATRWAEIQVTWFSKGQTDCPTPQSREIFLVIKQNSYLKPMWFFSFQKCKQAVPIKIIQDKTPMALEEEIKLLEKTAICKDLSTSLSTENEDEELKMLKKAAPPTVTQEQAEVRLESN